VGSGGEVLSDEEGDAAAAGGINSVDSSEILE
jgi:hypothetical protein